MQTQPLAIIVFLTALGCDRGGVSLATPRADIGGTAVPRVVINEVMANPRATPDERGEWLELRSLESRPIDLRGWTIASGNDRGATIDRTVMLAANGVALLARDGDPNALGRVVDFAYGAGLAFGNGRDWVAIRLPDGRTVDSVAWADAASGASRALTDPSLPHADLWSGAWATSVTPFGAGDLGSPGRANDGAPNVASVPVPAPERNNAPPTIGTTPVRPRALGADARDSTLTIRVLDVGQGDAILVENGGSRVLIDGGPDIVRFGRLIDRLGIDGSVVDAVILTHQHYDHYSGLRELFRSRRRISVRTVFDNKDAYANQSLGQLRDSIISRARRGELSYRDTDDPCGTGAASCTIIMRGGARLQVLRPHPNGEGPNNRSVAVRVLAADSTRFSMWLAGDAEQQAIAWFDATDYDRAPGMQSTVLKADHHGSCDGISPRYLDLIRPQVVALSLAGLNDYGYVHSQTLDLLSARRIPWYRTDQNGTITITVPNGSSHSVSVERGTASMRGPSDRPARNCGEDDRRQRR